MLNNYFTYQQFKYNKLFLFIKYYYNIKWTRLPILNVIKQHLNPPCLDRKKTTNLTIHLFWMFYY